MKPHPHLTPKPARRLRATLRSLRATRCSLPAILPAIASALALAALQPILSAQPAAASPGAAPALAIDHPPLPAVYFRDSKAYAWTWNGQAWQTLPRNEARVLHAKKETGKQHIGTLVIDGNYAVPAVSGQNVLLAFRKETNFNTNDGLPENETGIEVVKLDVKDGYKKNHLIRTAQLQRLGEAAATFGEKREPITVQKYVTREGVYHVVRVDAPLSSGRYALYLPDRAFEFAVQ
jgi:hypothetical protein